MPPARGPVFPFVSAVFTPQGRAPLDMPERIGGAAMQPGDLLLFENGVVHDKPRQVGSERVFRAALALRATRKVDRERTQDTSWLRWFARHARADPDGVRLLARNPYFQRLLRETATLDDAPVDPRKLIKHHDHDWPALVAALAG